MLRVLPALFLSGCCCCWGFGDGGGGGGGGLSDYVSERVAERVTEEVVGRAMGAEDVEVNDDGTVTIRTAEGEMVITEDENGEGGSFVVTGANGEQAFRVGQGAAAPDGFAITVKPGSTVVASMDMGQGVMVTATNPGSFAEVEGFYRARLGELGSVTDTMDSTSGTSRMKMLSATDGTKTYTVMIMQEASDDVIASLSVSAQ